MNKHINYPNYFIDNGFKIALMRVAVNKCNIFFKCQSKFRTDNP